MTADLDTFAVCPACKASGALRQIGYFPTPSSLPQCTFCLSLLERRSHHNPPLNLDHDLPIMETMVPSIPVGPTEPPAEPKEDQAGLEVMIPMAGKATWWPVGQPPSTDKDLTRSRQRDAEWIHRLHSAAENLVSPQFQPKPDPPTGLDDVQAWLERVLAARLDVAPEYVTKEYVR